MPLTPQQTIEFIDEKLSHYWTVVQEDEIGRFRAARLQDIRISLAASGFPTELPDLDLSLAPTFFQEAKYDGVMWWDAPDADLKHLKDLCELDFIVGTAGKQRAEASEEEFQEYCSDAVYAIGDYVVFAP